jgi:hypothetical protein
MIDNKGIKQNTFGEKLYKYLEKHNYSLRGYAHIVGINFSTLKGMMVKDTATMKNVSKMIHKDNRLLEIVGNHFNSLVEEKNQVQFSQVAEPQATYQTKPPNQNNKEIINLQRELIQLQQEVIKLNKEIIKLSK